MIARPVPGQARKAGQRKRKGPALLVDDLNNILIQSAVRVAQRTFASVVWLPYITGDLPDMHTQCLLTAHACKPVQGAAGTSYALRSCLFHRKRVTHCIPMFLFPLTGAAVAESCSAVNYC